MIESDEEKLESAIRLWELTGRRPPFFWTLKTFGKIVWNALRSELRQRFGVSIHHNVLFMQGKGALLLIHVRHTVMTVGSRRASGLRILIGVEDYPFSIRIARWRNS